ncbi:MAG: MerR family transcriptional regulator [Bacteroidetes bacterium GWF2_43_63]|nr:MAG: MerR family transcriptional regulator [Bacteroidetes bacterium GWE2_42_42]OFY52669.1 MAG: MerR family transcriptional regulator [Bacteroidetes bacterium GWF2_43_63]HBG69911.1 MerR family transcriptional regulator [Bacteroidales bacterium]HCB62663.1 MerR family transcriptional regulator [Bacteroidales bacterium]HCY23783.1 MerR family transcriptional regulator [Bacteroidales bacterium]
MQTENLIAVNDFCISQDIEISFISSLHQSGLIEIITVQETQFIEINQLQQLEKFIRFYYELDINIEGIETICHLLQRINTMQDEITTLKNKLSLYESYE